MSEIDLISTKLKCDSCDYIESDLDNNNLENYINKFCPKCGENLLTQDDYDQQNLLLGVISLMNLANEALEKEADLNTKKVKTNVGVHNNILSIEIEGNS